MLVDSWEQTQTMMLTGPQAVMEKAASNEYADL